MQLYICVVFRIPFHGGCPQDTEYSFLSFAVGPCLHMLN